MRSLNVGIAGLALLGGAALLPQSAMATATYSVDIEMETDAVIDGSATVAYENFYSGAEMVTAGTSFFGNIGDASSALTFGSSVPTVGVSGAVGPASLSFSQSGYASGLPGGVESRTREGYQSDFSVGGNDTLDNANTLGTVVTISNILAGSDLDLTVDFYALLAGTVDMPAEESWSGFASWTVQVSTREVGETEWGEFTAPFGELAGQLAGGFIAPITNRTTSGSEFVDTTTTFELGELDDALEYRYRISLQERGGARSSAVPVPAALPLLGAAIAGLGLVARRRKAA